MLETHIIDAATPTSCLNSAGAYFLPKKLVTVTVRGVAAVKPGYGLDVGDTLKTAPDRSEAYCLDYLGSPTSRDEIGIKRTSEGLLLRVYTRAEDKSLEIAKTLIDTGTLLAGAAGRAGILLDGDQTLQGEYTFDPFDMEEAAKVNAALWYFGYCVFVEGYSFPYGVPPQSWCERPRITSINVVKAQALGDPLPPAQLSHSGVLYRPNLTHTLTVLRKPNPKARGGWQLAMTRQIEVPNRAPVFVAKVNRSLFVDRVTDIEFAEGVLTNISVKKPSEMAAFVEIPLAIASAVTSLPGLIMKLKINDANNQERLILAQKELIAVRRQHASSIAALTEKHGPGSLPPGLSGAPPRNLDPGAELQENRQIARGL
jgi:hypothetical protein